MPAPRRNPRTARFVLGFFFLLVAAGLAVLGTQLAPHTETPGELWGILRPVIGGFIGLGLLALIIAVFTRPRHG